MQDKIISLLSKGLSQVEVARATGLTAGYISQVASDPINASLLAELAAQNINSKVTLDDTYDSIEAKAAEIILETLTTKGTLMEPMKVMKLMQVANTAKRRISNELKESSTSSPYTVTIQLPNVAMPHLTLIKSASNEVLQVGELELLTMPSSLVREQANKRDKEVIDVTSI
jgi:transcriptional regulator with XRE-family HTH domain